MTGLLTNLFERRKTKKFIHVNQHRIRSNLKNNENEPVLTCKFKGKNLYGHAVEIDGPSQLLYSGKFKLLPCGARVAIVTDSPIRLATDPDHREWISI